MVVFIFVLDFFVVLFFVLFSYKLLGVGVNHLRVWPIEYSRIHTSYKDYMREISTNMNTSQVLCILCSLSVRFSSQSILFPSSLPPWDSHLFPLLFMRLYLRSPTLLTNFLPHSLAILQNLFFTFHQGSFLIASASS